MKDHNREEGLRVYRRFVIRDTKGKRPKKVKKNLRRHGEIRL